MPSKITEYVKCECGCTVSKAKLKKHKESQRHSDFLEDPEKLKDYLKKLDMPREELVKINNKNYYERHKETINEKKKEHYQNNKNSIQERKKENYSKNKETINENRKNNKIDCECGITVRKDGYARHIKTQGHLDKIKNKK